MVKLHLPVVFLTTILLGACSEESYTPYTVSDSFVYESKMPVGNLTKDSVIKKINQDGSVTSFAKLDLLSTEPGEEVISLVKKDENNYSVFIYDESFSKKLYEKKLNTTSPVYFRIQSIYPNPVESSHYILIVAEDLSTPNLSGDSEFAIIGGGEKISVLVDDLFVDNAVWISSASFTLGDDGLVIKSNDKVFDYYNLYLGEFTSLQKNLIRLQEENVEKSDVIKEEGGD